MRLLIVGQNPAKGKEGVPAFLQCKSGDVLFNWLSKARSDWEGFVIETENIWHKEGKLPKSDNLRLKALYLVNNKRYDRIITVGKISDKYVRPLVGEHVVLNIPHPSGLNRQLNDKKVIDKIIKDLKEFLST